MSKGAVATGEPISLIKLETVDNKSKERPALLPTTLLQRLDILLLLLS